MKKINFFILWALVGAYPAMATAVMTTAAIPGQKTSATTNTVKTQFGLSGTITRYQPRQSSITIDGKKYILRGKGGLKNSDLKPGKKIKYNLERSSSSKVMDRVTRIWIEKKK